MIKYFLLRRSEDMVDHYVKFCFVTSKSEVVNILPITLPHHNYWPYLQTTVNQSGYNSCVLLFNACRMITWKCLFVSLQISNNGSSDDQWIFYRKVYDKLLMKESSVQQQLCDMLTKYVHLLHLSSYKYRGVKNGVSLFNVCIYFTFDVLYMVIWCTVYGHLMYCIWSFDVLYMVIWCTVYGHLMYCIWPFDVLYMTIWCTVYGHLMYCIWSFDVLYMAIWCTVYGHLMYRIWPFDVLYMAIWCTVYGHLMYCIWPFDVLYMAIWCTVYGHLMYCIWPFDVLYMII